MILAHSTHTWLPLTEQWIYRQVKHIQGMEQIVLCDRRDEAFDAPVPVYVNPAGTYDWLPRIRKKLGLPESFRKNILSAQEDAILFSHYGIQGYRDLNLKKKKHIIRFYGYDLTRTMKADIRWVKRYARLFDQGDLFVVEGHHMKQVLMEMGAPEKKIKVSYLGAEIENIRYQERKESDILQVMIACATAERKGIIYALQAVNKLIHEYKIPLHLHWVGARNSDYSAYIDYENLLLDFIKTNQLQPHITNYGFVSPLRLQEIASQCQVALHPSVWAADGDCEGGYPVVIPDLMAGGLPVISTYHCDIPEVINQENGYLCQEKDVDALVAALMDCVEHQTYLQKSKLARATVETKFNWNILGKQLTEIILS